MKIFIRTLLPLTLLLGACSSGRAPAQANAAETPATIATAAPAATEPESTGQASAAREAVLSEVENAVSVRASAGAELTPASNGMTVSSGGSIDTGANGRVRLDLNPEGTVIRVGPNSSFSVPELTDENGQPKTTIQLFFGKIFVLLKGGSLDVSTPSGVASVRGSLLSVEYDKENQRIVASCLEGHCTMEDENGDEMELPEGQESFITEGEPPAQPFEMDRDEVQDWLDQNPELDQFMSELPNPEDFPDLPPDYFDQAPLEEYTNPDDIQPTPTDDPTEPLPTDDPTQPLPTDAPTEPLPAP